MMSTGDLKALEEKVTSLHLPALEAELIKITKGMTDLTRDYIGVKETHGNRRRSRYLRRKTRKPIKV